MFVTHTDLRKRFDRRLDIASVVSTLSKISVTVNKLCGSIRTSFSSTKQ